MESGEHVRGCLCHDKLCPPSGVCTPQGCIDPLTDKPFEKKMVTLSAISLDNAQIPKDAHALMKKSNIGIIVIWISPIFR